MTTNNRKSVKTVLLFISYHSSTATQSLLEGDSFARSSDRFAQFDDSSVMSEFGNENKNKNSLSQVTEVVI